MIRVVPCGMDYSEWLLDQIRPRFPFDQSSDACASFDHAPPFEELTRAAL